MKIRNYYKHKFSKHNNQICNQYKRLNFWILLKKEEKQLNSFSKNLKEDILVNLFNLILIEIPSLKIY